MDVIRTPDERFADIEAYHYAPRYHEWTEPGGTSRRARWRLSTFLGASFLQASLHALGLRVSTRSNKPHD